MEILNGKYNYAKVFNCTELDDATRGQIHAFLNNEVSSGSNIVVMPDTHAGKGCVVGMTMTITDKVMPNLVGVDIGCGVTVAKIKARAKDLDFNRLDKIIGENVPSGFKIRQKPHKYGEMFDFDKLYCFKHMNIDRARLSIGTLGGGNHFIEVDKDGDDNLYLTVHSGSRHLGVEIADWYIKQGNEVLKERGVEVPYELTYVDGPLKVDYLHDVRVATEYAYCNREAIITEITKNMKWGIEDVYNSVHNYIDFSHHAEGIMRKGAISAEKYKKVIIPINMRDGIILGTGKGNPEWNFSAPHGAGRLFSRKQAKEQFTVNQFKASMEGIHCTCINQGTLDESPFVYRDMDDILNVIHDTVEVEKIIKPIYSFKASETRKW